MKEAQIIHTIKTSVVSFHRHLLKGVGDDAAVFVPPPDALVLCSTDLLVEHIDFNLTYTPLRLLGKKSLAVNLSDIAAMGGTPLYYLVSIAAPKNRAVRAIREIYNGLQDVSRQYRVTLIGGDLSAAPRELFICVTIIGKGTKNKVIFRSGAKPGDLIFVTGQLGASATGLKLLKRGYRLNRSTGIIRRAILAHLDPQPPCKIGAWLASHQFPSAMIDLSDGLSTDLHHVCHESQVGAFVQAGSIPVSDVTRALDADPEASAYHGGEDFELLFTVPRRKAPSLLEKYRRFSKYPLTKIGEIFDKKFGIILEDGAGKRRALPPGGYDHFKYPVRG